MLMRHLYTSIALPKLLYTIDVWFTPIHSNDNNDIRRGSITAAKKLNQVQRIVLLSMTGALRSMATDVLEAHANLHPLDLRIQNICHQAAIRLASHPNSHPISLLLRQVSKQYIKRHKSSLHHLTHAYTLDPSTIEKIHPARRRPNEASPHSSNIAQTKEDSIQDHNDRMHGTRVYSDGSRLNNKIGAAAVLYRPNGSTRTL